jgi:cytochrome b involved in lipid metabolism
MTEEKFEEEILKGKRLWILDDMVLDLTYYMPNHPGGAFLLEQNIGRDISKFFYGGY